MKKDITTRTLTPASRLELKETLTSKTDGYSYNYFEGCIRRGDRYARLHYYFTGNKITINITYWQDGKDVAVARASNCSTPTGVANKIAMFLGLK